MRKFLIFLAILLNLQLIADAVGLRWNGSNASAQNYDNEQQGDMMTCALCGKYLSWSEFISHDCGAVDVDGKDRHMATCVFCGATYYVRDTHYCQTDIEEPKEPCQYCGGIYHISDLTDHENGCPFNPNNYGEDDMAYAPPLKKNTQKETTIHACSCLATQVRKTAAGMVNTSTIKKINTKTGFSAESIASSLQKTIEFPGTVRQGVYGTCGAAEMERILATYHPYLFRECIYSLVQYGYYEKWNLILPEDCGLKSMTDKMVDNKGLAAVDVIFQTAFYDWARRQDSWYKKREPFHPTVKEATGKGGIKASDIEKYCLIVDGQDKSNSKTNRNTCDCIIGSGFSVNNNALNVTDYTVIADVRYANGKFDGEKSTGYPNHWVEVIGIDNNGDVHFLSYGKEYTVNNLYCYQKIKHEKTKEVKADEKAKNSLSCACPKCTTGCGNCK